MKEITVGQVRQCLIAAKKLLKKDKKPEPGKALHICVAIAMTTHPFGVRNLAKAFVRYRLGDCYSVEIWLDSYLSDSACLPDKQLQKYRQAWLDHLIEELA